MGAISRKVFWRSVLGCIDYCYANSILSYRRTLNRRFGLEHVFFLEHKTLPEFVEACKYHSIHTKIDESVQLSLTQCET